MPMDNLTNPDMAMQLPVWAPSIPKTKTLTVVPLSPINDRLEVLNRGLSALGQKLEGYKTASITDVVTTFNQLDSSTEFMADLLSDIRRNMVAAAIEAAQPAPSENTALMSGSSVPLRKGYKPEGMDIIYLGELNHKRIGHPLNIFVAPENHEFGYTTKIMQSTGKIKNLHGFDGLDLGPFAGYEDRLFRTWQDGTGLNKWVVMPLVVLAGKDNAEQDRYFDSNLIAYCREGDLKMSFWNSQRETFGSCTPERKYGDRYQMVADLKKREVHNLSPDSRPLSYRLCLAQEPAVK